GYSESIGSGANVPLSVNAADAHVPASKLSSSGLIGRQYGGGASGELCANGCDRLFSSPFWNTTSGNVLPWRCAHTGNVCSRRPYGNVSLLREPVLKSARPGRLPRPNRPVFCVM